MGGNSKVISGTRTAVSTPGRKSVKGNALLANALRALKRIKDKHHGVV